MIRCDLSSQSGGPCWIMWRGRRLNPKRPRPIRIFPGLSFAYRFRDGQAEPLAGRDIAGALAEPGGWIWIHLSPRRHLCPQLDRQDCAHSRARPRNPFVRRRASIARADRRRRRRRVRRPFARIRQRSARTRASAFRAHRHAGGERAARPRSAPSSARSTRSAKARNFPTPSRCWRKSSAISPTPWRWWRRNYPTRSTPSRKA